MSKWFQKLIDEGIKSGKLCTGASRDPKPDPREWGNIGLYFTSAVTTVVEGVSSRDPGMIASGAAGVTAGGTVIVNGLVDAATEFIKEIKKIMT